MIKRDELKEGVHYYFNEKGLMVFTEEYHQQRGYCCGQSCKHCPFNHENVGKKGTKDLRIRQAPKTGK